MMMKHGPLDRSDRAALDVAATPTLKRIRKDVEKAAARANLRCMMQHIEQHLYSPDLNVNHVKAACGIRDNSVAIHFHAFFGDPPHAYITKARLEIACRLLETSNLAVWKISEILGFSSIQVFSRSFARRIGKRPSVYRRIHQKSAPPTTSLGRESIRDEVLVKIEGHIVAYESHHGSDAVLDCISAIVSRHLTMTDGLSQGSEPS